MLTPEDKQRIEEEEAYRATVRARVTKPGTPKWRTNLAIWGLSILIVFGLMFIFSLLNQSKADHDDPLAKSSPGPLFRPEYVPAYSTLTNGQITVPAGNVWYLSFVIPNDAVQANVYGRFNAAGGTGNDIEAVLMDQTEFTNWINGHQINVYYTSGKETTGSFNRPLQPGSYILGLDNRFSAFSAKYVSIEAALRYQHPKP